MVITKDTIIGEILRQAPETVPMFTSIGMHCLGCALSSGETLEQACVAHNVDVGEFMEALESYMALEDGE